ncbi:MAG: OmpA family protein [Bryobacteraceae bacterium]|nr:OmpA family protein [Bryobacteraceae bacterium]
MTSLITRPVLIGSVALFGVIGTGCATKKYVRQQVDPVQQRVEATEKTNTEQAGSLNKLERDVSQVDERAQDAERKATSAGQEAGRAHTEIARVNTSLGQRIDTMGQDTQRRMGELQRSLDPANYKMVLEENFLFPFGKATLSKDAKAAIDAAVQRLGNMGHYDIEVQGFTDQSGGTNYNMNLSQQRAQAVVRYLATQHNIPLRRIFVLGVGEVQDQERGREARKQARRVEMRVFAPQTATASTETGASQTRSPGQ